MSPRSPQLTLHTNNSKTFIGVPGIHSGRKALTDSFLSRLSAKGHHTEDPDLAYRWAITAWFNLNRDAREVMDVIRDGDILICHSYGCARGTRAVEMAWAENNERVRVLFLIAPAMSAKYDFTGVPSKTKIVCLYSSEDEAVRWGSRIPFHFFGKAGNVGFRDPRVINVKVPGNDHNDYFNEVQIDKWVDYSLLLASS